MTVIIKKLREMWKNGPTKMALAAVCAHSTSISIGICQGYSAILIPQLVKSPDFRITEDQGSWLASLGAVTNPIGSILSGILAEYFGRTKSIQISSIPFIVGWILITFSNNIYLLYSGRLITGIAAGMSTACYTYVAEISTQGSRGLLQALGPVSASFGILFTYTLGYFTSWKIVALISTTFGVFTMISMQFLPESPPYLLKKGLKEESFKSLMWFRGNSSVVVQSEFDAMSDSDTSTKGTDKKSCKEMYLRPSTIKPFFILIILFLLQELSGIYSVLFYAVNFFQDFNMDIDEYLSSIIVGVVRFLMSIVGAVLICKFGRKTLCCVSSGGMGCCLLITAFYVKYYEVHHGEKLISWLPLLCVLGNVFFSMIGMLPIPWILVGEMFALDVRSIMSGVVICIAQCFIFICVKIYPDLLNLLRFSGTLFSFVVASFVTVIFCQFFLVETRNKSLLEIENYFKKKPSESKSKEEEEAKRQRRLPQSAVVLDVYFLKNV